jgi:hypothetical protein
MTVEFVETVEFSKKVHRYLNDEQLSNLRVHLILHPKVGKVIPRSKGLRKVRWSGNGKGKKGGLRVIHFNRLENNEIWLLDIYAKSEKENIGVKYLKILRKGVTNEKTKKKPRPTIN